MTSSLNNPRIAYFSALTTTLRLIENNCLKEKPLLNHNIFLKILPSMACIGYVGEDGWHPCPTNEKGVMQCESCAAHDTLLLYTKLDKTVVSETFYKKHVSKPFAIYLAAVGDVVKVGVAQQERVLSRVKEQGVDAYAILLENQNAEVAYSLERYICTKYGITDRILTKTKISFLDKTRGSEEAIIQVLDKLKEDVFFSTEIKNTEIKTLDWSHLPLHAQPSDHIDGKVIGNKGKLVFWVDDKERSNYFDISHGTAHYVELRYKDSSS